MYLKDSLLKNIAANRDTGSR